MGACSRMYGESHMPEVYREIRTGELPAGQRDFVQEWPEIFQAAIRRFLERLRDYAFTQARFPGICKRISRRVDRWAGTTWEAFFHNREINFHRNNYPVSPRARVFIHVPRTGGTSAGHYLRKIGAPRIQNLHEHHAISVSHPPAFHRYFTILRDPVERCWSFYRLTLYGNSATPYRRAAERGLEHFCRHCWEMRNLYCRYFSGAVWQEPDADTLAEAGRQLKRFEAVLDFSSLDEQMDKLASRWGLRQAPFLHQNQAPGPKLQMDPRSRRILEEHNALDRQLYEEFRGGFIKGFEEARERASARG